MFNPKHPYRYWYSLYSAETLTETPDSIEIAIINLLAALKALRS